MAFIGEITIKVEFPEAVSREDGLAVTESLAHDIKEDLRAKLRLPTIYANSTGYDEEEMRKELDDTAPCHNCIHMDNPQEEEPCFACCVNPHCYPHYMSEDRFQEEGPDLNEEGDK